MKTVSLKISEDLDSSLERVARGHRMSKSEIVRKALLRYLPAAGEGRLAGSFLERAGSFVGCVDGPTDLSNNPRHLRGYGV